MEVNDNAHLNVQVSSYAVAGSIYAVFVVSLFTPVKVTQNRSSNHCDVCVYGAGYFQWLQPGGKVSCSRNARIDIGEERLPALCSPDKILSFALTRDSIGSGGIVQITPNGFVTVVESGRAESEIRTRLKLVIVTNPQLLIRSNCSVFDCDEKLGGLRRVEAGSKGGGFIRHGWIETSERADQFWRSYSIKAILIGAAVWVLCIF